MISEPRTWADLAEKDRLIEDPFSILEVDPVRWDPDATQSRMEKIANALMDLYRQHGENQKQITLLGTRKAKGYPELRSAQILIESKINALERKHDILRSRSILKGQEFRSAR